jgi:predicted membrane chloride channel (bestrophin family)
MISMEVIARESSEPFGRGLDDLALDEICKRIEESVQEAVDCTDTQRGRGLDDGACVGSLAPDGACVGLIDG